MKTITIALEYNGEGESWEEIKDDAKNNKIKNVFIGSKEFVNVVRCKDCKWWNTDWYKGVHGECPNVFCETTADYFCADGERKDGEVKNNG